MASGEGRTDAAERDRGLEVLLDVLLEVVFREPAPVLAAVVGFFLRDVVAAALGALLVFFFAGFFVTLAAVFFFFFDDFLATLAAGFLSSWSSWSSGSSSSTSSRPARACGER